MCLLLRPKEMEDFEHRDEDPKFKEGSDLLLLE